MGTLTSVWMTMSITVDESAEISGIFSRPGLSFENNHYTVIGADPTNFAWRGDEQSWTQWQQYGNDLGGSFTRR